MHDRHKRATTINVGQLRVTGCMLVTQALHVAIKLVSQLPKKVAYIARTPLRICAWLIDIFPLSATLLKHIANLETWVRHDVKCAIVPDDALPRCFPPFPRRNRTSRAADCAAKATAESNCTANVIEGLAPHAPSSNVLAAKLHHTDLHRDATLSITGCSDEVNRHTCKRLESV